MTEASLAHGVLMPIRHVLSAERPLMLVGRNSGETGSDARRQAVNDLLEAADWLAAAGRDMRRDLPTKTELLELLRSADPIRSKDKDGRAFANRIVTIDLRAKHSVYVVLSVGTGKKLDEHGVQPFVQYLAETAATIKPCLLFARRLDRITRRAWALGPVMLNLTELSGYIGDADFGICPADGIDSVLVFFRAQAGEEEARKLPLRSRHGMIRESGTSLAAGACTYAFAAPVPPGFMSYRSNERGMIGRRIITFDTPSCRPPDSNVAAGLPQVVEQHADGSLVPVDQVANVRWALRMLGHPGWSIPAIAKGLAARSYSTEALRRTHGPAATYTVDYANEKAYKVLQSIKNNLDMYETGVMTLNLGVDGVGPASITDCFPPDGLAWASSADFTRIRKWLGTNLRPSRRATVLSGLPVAVNGADCVIVRRGGSGDLLTAVLTHPYRSQGRQVSPDAVIALQPEAIIEAFVRAISELGDTALALVPFETSDQLALSSAEISAAKTRLRVLHDERQAIESQLLARDSDRGELQVSGALLTRLNERYNTIVDTDEPAVRAELLQLESQAEQHRRQAVEQQAGVAVERLLHLISSLRDPSNTTFRDLIHRTIRDLTITAQRCTLHRRVWWTYDIRFTIHINTDHGMVVVPVSHTCRYRNAFDPEALAVSTLETLCETRTTWDDVKPLADVVLRRHLATHLGIHSRKLMLPNVTDPRLANLAARVLTSDLADIPAIAADTGESEAFLRRVRDLHRDATRAVWFAKPQVCIAAWYRLAAEGPVTKQVIEEVVPATWETARNLLYVSASRDQWLLTDDGYLLEPCPICSSRRRSPARIPEPAGLICLTCETDEAGERWPLDPYSRYLVVSSPNPT